MTSNNIHTPSDSRSSLQMHKRGWGVETKDPSKIRFYMKATCTSGLNKLRNTSLSPFKQNKLLFWHSLSLHKAINKIYELWKV